MLDTYLSADPNGVRRAINYLSSSGNWHDQSIANALIFAIKKGDATTALKLLEMGAKPGFSQAVFAKATQHLLDNAPSYALNNLKQNFEQNSQPILVAIEKELPQVALELLERGVDVNTLSARGHDVLRNTHSQNYTTGETILDLVNSKIQTLREWKPDEAEPEPPTPLKSDDEYLKHCEEGSYQMWTAQGWLKQAKIDYENRFKTYSEEKKRFQERKGLEEKQAAIYDMLDGYRKVLAALQKGGAQSFYERYPDINKPQDQQRHGDHYTPAKQPEFEVKFTFRVNMGTDEVWARYADMYNAVWHGNIDRVKRYTLEPWTDTDGHQHEPLHVAVQDKNNLSPFAIALLRGHRELADLLLEFSKAQYSPENEENVKTRTRLRGQGDAVEDSDSEDVDEDNDAQSGITLEEEVIGDKYTIENVGEVMINAKSKTSPTTMIEWYSSQYKAFTEQKMSGSAEITNKRTHTGSNKTLKEMTMSIEHRKKYIPAPKSLVQYALWTDDADMLRYVIGAAKKYHSPTPEEGKRYYHTRIVEQRIPDFDYAIRLDRPHLLAILMEMRGDGIPLRMFLKLEKEVIEQQYYQGLSVHGKKKKEWALRKRGTHVTNVSYANDRPPLLIAAYRGALATYQWLQSDEPLRLYKEYAKNNIDAQELQDLEAQKGGFEKLVEDFLATRTELSIHCCLMAAAESDMLELLQYLVKDMPGAIDHKSEDGTTPLHLAFSLRRTEAIEVLINAGANQTLRDREGQNVVHRLLTIRQYDDERECQELRKLINLIDKRVLPSLFVERTAAAADSETPFSQWISRRNHASNKSDICKMLLEYSGGAELDLVNGLGEVPLHTAIRVDDTTISGNILDRSPCLLNRENAAGLTSYEIVEAEVTAGRFRWVDLPDSGYHHYYCHNNHSSDLLNRSSESFVKRSPQKNEKPVTLWSLMQDTKVSLDSAGSGKRKLVTLNEALEVARRLAAKCNRNMTNTGVRRAEREKQNYEKLEAQDEVAAWRGNAAGIGHYDEKWE